MKPIVEALPPGVETLLKMDEWFSGIPRPSINNYIRALWEAWVIERQHITEERPVTFIRYNAPMDQ